MRNSYLLFLAFPLAVGAQWDKHIIVESSGIINSAVAADWNGDDQMDVIASLDGKVILFEGPEWRGAHATRFRFRAIPQQAPKRLYPQLPDGC